MCTKTDSQEITKISYYAHWTKESVRYNDTDRQGHVNNAVFVTFLEAGRNPLAERSSDRDDGFSHGQQFRDF